MKNLHLVMNTFTNASRILKISESLDHRGIFDEVDIIALGSKDLPAFEKVQDNINLYRINLITKSLPKNLLFQVVKYIEFYTKALFYIYKINPHVINAHSLSVLPIAYSFSSIFKKKVIYDTHELETERNGLYGFRKKISKLVESNLIKKVDLVIVVSNSIASWYSNQYRIKKPLVILNSPKIRNPHKTNFLRKNLGIDANKKILIYQGALSRGRGIEQLLEAFKYRQNDSLALVFMGYGELEELIKIAATNYSDIYFHEAVNPNIVLDYTSSADFGINLGQKICLSYDYSMPNKLFEYCMVGLPVIVSNLKEMSECVLNNNIGTVIYDYTPLEINKKLDELLSQDLSELRENSYRFAINNSWEKQEAKLIKAYMALISDGEPSDE